MQQRGFTLIELIIVIVILGILAVTAAPRFLDLSTDARASAMQGVVGAVRSSSQIAHAALLIRDTDAVVEAEGVQIQSATVAAVNRYPHAEDICDLIGLTDGSAGAGAVSPDDASDNYTCTVTDGDTLVITDDNATTPANCSVTYVEAAAADAAPAITIDTSAC